MEWSTQQKEAIDAVSKWYKDKHSNQIFRLFGYAGTGKTTLARHFAEGISGKVLYMAYTGKAALELRKKNCKNASTIHSSIYIPDEDINTGLTTFKLNPESDVKGAKLIIIDEVSFVNESLAKDLMSYGVKILVLGDPAQLPPIEGEGFFINAEPDYFLTEIHRQAKDNPIIWLSMMVREGKTILPGNYGDSRVLVRKNLDPVELKEMAIAADQVICGMNRTRQSLNSSIRKLKGLSGRRADFHPTQNDKLICLRNSKEKGFLNGGMWEVVGFNPVYVAGTPPHIRLQIKSEDDPRLKQVIVRTLEGYFDGTENEYDWRVKKKYDEFTYGQWDYVLAFDESSVFRDYALNWKYTILTRASERIDLLI